MDPEDWSTSGEPTARGSLLGWVIFLVLVVSLLVLEVAVGFFGGRSLAAHTQVDLLVPALGGGLVALAYVLAWRDERFRPPLTEDDRLSTAAVLVFIAVYFGAIQFGLASSLQLWLAVTAIVAVIVAGRAYYVRTA
jgi:hypothetical protein